MTVEMMAKIMVGMKVDEQAEEVVDLRTAWMAGIKVLVEARLRINCSVK